jgi:hypothetical protein
LVDVRGFAAAVLLTTATATASATGCDVVHPNVEPLCMFAFNMMFPIIICILSFACFDLRFLAGVGKTNRGEMVNHSRLGISGATSG